MKFIMFVCPAEGFTPPATLGAETEMWSSKYDAAGVRVIGDVLEPEGSGVIVGQGPQAPSEAIAGFDVLECDDLAHARRVVEEHPMSQFGSIVVRPFMFQ